MISTRSCTRPQGLTHNCAKRSCVFCALVFCVINVYHVVLTPQCKTPRLHFMSCCYLCSEISFYVQLYGCLLFQRYGTLCCARKSSRGLYKRSFPFLYTPCFFIALVDTSAKASCFSLSIYFLIQLNIPRIIIYIPAQYTIKMPTTTLKSGRTNLGKR